MNTNENTMKISDKRALMNLAIHIVDEMRKVGIDNEEIEKLLRNFDFSYLMIGQIMY